MERTSFNVPSISCSVCSNKIQNELKGTEGIQDVNIDLKTQMVTVEYDSGKLQPQNIRKKITTMGYEIV
jgi:copper chaperone